MSLCACTAPPGDCPCIRKREGRPVEITESFIASNVFALLSDEDKNTINDLKFKALCTWLDNNKE